MERRFITAAAIEQFRRFLINDEKSAATIEKYVRDITTFSSYSQDCILSKETIIGYKQHLLNEGYAISSINSMLASLNCFFSFLGWSDLKIKFLKVQHQIFCPEGKELTRAEYERLCHAALALGKKQTYLILQTLCGMGIRVSELPFITVEAVKRGSAVISLKGKTRTAFLVKSLRKKLLQYIAEQNITEGSIFITRNGKPVDRSNIWREMKSLCKEANVDPQKVFPHNLRHLFARTFYNLENDIVKLADILGHSSINTTRIYIISTGAEHWRRMERMQLVI